MRHTFAGLFCPVDMKHGVLHEIDSPTGKQLRCIHQAHDGRPRSHADGPAEQTRAVFTMDEIEQAAAARRRGE